MNRTRLTVVAAITLTVAGAGAYYLLNIALPKSMEALGKAVPSLVNATVDQAARLVGPEAVPVDSRIMMGPRTVGDLTLQFKLKRDESAIQKQAASSSTSGLLRAFENPDSSLLLNGRLRNGAVARKLRADSLLVALVVGPLENGRPIVVHIMERRELGSAVPIGFLWLPADSLMFVLHHAGS